MHALDALITQLKTAQKLVVVTGGGMSAESGVASFRQAIIGPWAAYDVRDLATPQAYARNPKLVWQWYNFRRGQTQTAGSRDILELNGSVHRTRCVESGHPGDWEEEGDIPPRCQRCGSQLRPDVVLLGEGFARSDVRRAQTAVETCDAILFVGELSAADPVAQFPFIAKRSGARVLTINTDPASIFSVMADVHINQTPGNALPTIVAGVTRVEGS